MRKKKFILYINNGTYGTNNFFLSVLDKKRNKIKNVAI